MTNDIGSLMRRLADFIHFAASFVVVVGGLTTCYGAFEIWTGNKKLDAKVTAIVPVHSSDNATSIKRHGFSGSTPTEMFENAEKPANVGKPTNDEKLASPSPTYSITFEFVNVPEQENDRR